MTKSQIILTTSVAVVAAIAVKMIFFPSINDKYFTATANRLKAVPAGYLVIRPTHFAHGYISQPSRLTRSYNNGNQRLAGFNVTFQRLIALAYNENPARVSLPWNAPTNKNYDVLFTGKGDMSPQLQVAIHRKFGFVADRETNDVPVLALKIENPNLQAFKVSPDSEKRNEDMKNGKVYFTHTPLNEISQGLEQIAGSPVVDETGLTNFYDFSLTMTPQLQKLMQSGAQPDKDTMIQILDEWGLGFEPDTAPMEMLVVKKVY